MAESWTAMWEAWFLVGIFLACGTWALYEFIRSHRRR